MGSKYDPITAWLNKEKPRTIKITISELSHLLHIDFPEYVHKYTWGNDRTQPLPRAFMSAGYLVSQPEKDKEILCFRYEPNRSNELLSGLSHNQHRSRKMARSDVPRPCVAEVEKYLQMWDKQENYVLQEAALDKLFLHVYPQNDKIEDILIKVSCLNDFYSTNIYSPFTVAKHIQQLGIDDRLRTGDPTLIEELASVHMANDKTKNFYSFATKYCSHHQPFKYAIWDSYVDEVLRYFRDTDGFADFGFNELKRYEVFANVLKTFAAYYGLQRYSLKDLDRYLWQLGKDKFPQKRYQNNK